MGLLDNLEHGLEKAVRSAFSAGGSRAVQPVEIASALRHAMDDQSFALSEGHTVAPNDFTVHFAPADFERARTWGNTLAGELCDEVIRHAESQGYSLPGAVRVAFHSDDAVRAGRVEVVAVLDDGSAAARQTERPAPAGATTPPPADLRAPEDAVHRAPRRAAAPTPSSSPRPARAATPPRAPRPAAAPARPAPGHDEPTVAMPRGGASRPALPALEFDGAVHPISAEDVVVGRSAERADVVVPDSSVSRQHLRLVRVGPAVTLIDLGSRNGVEVNGHRVDGSTVLREGDRITVGQTEMVFHAAPDRSRA